ncbi:MAG: SdpI family protein [Caulobacterales bacterium]
MKLNRSTIIAGGLVAATVGLALWGYVRLPADVAFPINYGLDGRPHGHVGKAIGLAIMPAVSAGVTLLLMALPRIAPNRKGLDASTGFFGLLISSLAGLFLVSEAALIAMGFDPSFDVLRWVFLATAVLLLLVGNMLGKVRHNYVFGIKTPWTLADARVWDKTHRFAGRLMVLGALVLSAVAAFRPDHWLLIVVLVSAAAGPFIAGAVYSRLVASAPSQA